MDGTPTLAVDPHTHVNLSTEQTRVHRIVFNTSTHIPMQTIYLAAVFACIAYSQKSLKHILNYAKPLTCAQIRERSQFQQIATNEMYMSTLNTDQIRHTYDWPFSGPGDRTRKFTQLVTKLHDLHARCARAIVECLTINNPAGGPPICLVGRSALITCSACFAQALVHHTRVAIMAVERCAAHKWFSESVRTHKRTNRWHTRSRTLTAFAQCAICAQIYARPLRHLINPAGVVLWWWCVRTRVDNI